MDYIFASSAMLMPIINEFGPEAIIISCGFDSAAGDPLGGIGLTPIGYAWMTHALLRICPEIVVLLEGGYNLDALAINSETVIEVLRIGDDTDAFNKYLKESLGSEKSYFELSLAAKEKPGEEFKAVYDKLKPLLAPYWKCIR